MINSEKEGYPLDEGVDYVKIGQVGQSDNVIHEVKLINAHKRWPEQWKAYQEGREQVADGMPLDMLFPGNPETVSTLKANHVHTIEQLAALTDGNQFKFAEPLIAKARKFVQARRADAMPAMEQKMAELMATIEALKQANEEKPRRGRPPLVKTPERELANE